MKKKKKFRDFFIYNFFFSTLRLNFGRTKKVTAEPMVLSYVGHFYKYLKKKLENSLERFFRKGQKTSFIPHLYLISPPLKHLSKKRPCDVRAPMDT